MFKKMVVLLDGSTLAKVVFGYAQELAARLGLEVELLHVCSPQEEDQLPMRRIYMRRMAKELCAKADEMRAAYTKEAMVQCIVARGRVVVGQPAEKILEYVEDNDIDLVMLSTHGKSGVKTWDLGEVANRVVHASRVPVWLVPAELRKEVLADALPNRPLVVPLSGSQNPESAIPYAVNLIEQRGAESELVLLYVVENLSMPHFSAPSPSEKQGADPERKKAEQYLEGLAKPVRESGIAVRTEVLSGDPAEAIIDYLKDNPSQLLVMATSDRSRLSRMVFGSVTESIIHMVKVTPLLLVGSGE